MVAFLYSPRLEPVPTGVPDMYNLYLKANK
jgi:hypothetical protein